MTPGTVCRLGSPSIQSPFSGRSWKTLVRAAVTRRPECSKEKLRAEPSGLQSCSALLLGRWVRSQQCPEASGEHSLGIRPARKQGRAAELQLGRFSLEVGLLPGPGRGGHSHWCCPEPGPLLSGSYDLWPGVTEGVLEDMGGSV